MMPEFLKLWLESLTAEQANAMWLWFDSYQQDDAIEIVAKKAIAAGFCDVVPK